MATAPLKACNVPGCVERHNNRSGLCDLHEAEKLKAYAKDYDDRRGSSSKRGYGSRWQRIRAAALRRCPLCIECLRKEGRAEQAKVVHHIDGDQFNNKNNNLMCLCRECHERMHGRLTGDKN